MKVWRCLSMLIALLAITPAWAHDSLPLVIVIEENAPGLFTVRTQQPPALGSDSKLGVRLSGKCTALPGSVSGTLYTCENDIGGAVVGWTLPTGAPPVPTLVRLSLASGETWTLPASPEKRELTLPDRESAIGVTRDYIRLGVEHLLFGFDHLLFLFCLLWIAGSFRRVLLVATGFTLAHSLTLGLAALSVIRLPAPPVEAGIALSIMFLSREIWINRRDTLTWRHPFIVASLFGLLHGLGFASVLGEIGLPQTQLIAGLVAFNVGVEIGQIMVIAAIFGLIAVTHGILRARILGGGLIARTDMAATAKRIALLAVGGISSFWFVDRVAGFL